MSNSAQPDGAQTLTSMADMGELMLMAMRPPALGFSQDLVVAERAAQWAQLATFAVRVTLGESKATELAPTTSGRTSPNHPQPEGISPDLADAWDDEVEIVDFSQPWGDLDNPLSGRAPTSYLCTSPALPRPNKILCDAKSPSRVGHEPLNRPFFPRWCGDVL